MFGELKLWFQQLTAAKQVEVDEVEFVGEQAKFLLTQAALVEISDQDDPLRLAAVRTTYGYMHPLTFHAIVGDRATEHGNGLFYTIDAQKTGRITIWILTTLLPEGTVIAGPNLMPGLEDLVRNQILKEEASRAQA